jgi:uncharacterized protein (DUF2147 family)
MRPAGSTVLIGLFSLIGSFSLSAVADDLSTPTGLWQALDSSGRPEGRIRFYESHGAYFGRIEPSKSGDDSLKRCSRCTDERKDQPYDSLVIIRNLRFDGNEYTGGDVLDPDTGRIYGCKMKLIDGGHRMIMRGFFGISLLGRSQTWERVETPGP